MQDILVSGATGFTGSHVIPLLVERHTKVTCLVRPTSDRSPVELAGVSFVEGDLSDPRRLHEQLQGKDIYIHIANLMGSTKTQGTRASAVVSACRSAGVRRAVFV